MPRRRKTVAPLDPIEVLQSQVSDLQRTIARMKQAGSLAMQTDDWEKSIDPVQGQVAISHPGRHGRANAVSGVTFFHNNRMQNINSGANFVIKVFADDEDVETGDKAFAWSVPEDVDTLQLCYTEAACTDEVNSGVVQVDLFNMTQSLALLSTKIEIDSGQHHSHASLPLPVIIQANSQVDFMDLIRIDIDSAGSGRKGLAVTMVFL